MNLLTLRGLCLVLAAWLCAILQPLHAQAEADWADDGVVDMPPDDDEADGAEQWCDELAELANGPLDLNRATPEELSLLPFLGSRQVEELSAYLYKYGPMRSMGELSLIESLDERQRQLLRRVAIVGDSVATARFPTWRQVAQWGKHELTATARLPFYTREGDRSGYLGYPYRHWLRYAFHCGQSLRLGLVAAQDAGEPFLAGRNAWGYDYYSFYLMLRGMGRLRALAVGRYRLRLGLGLALGNGYLMGKQAQLAAVPTTATKLVPHASRTESTYLQGAAATLGLSPSLSLTAFASWREVDATLSTDGQGIATLLRTGYHRTESEMHRKHNAAQWAAGAHGEWHHGAWRIGATGVGTGFSKPLQPNTAQLYRRWQAAGRNFWNAAIDYAYTAAHLQVAGETATGDGGGMATLNQLAYQPAPGWQLTALQRFYSYRYHAPLAQAFAAGGHVQNESGLCVSAQWQATRRLSLMAYADYAYLPWARYRISQASHAWDLMGQGTWQHRRHSLTLRYRLRLRQRDQAAASTLQDIPEHRLRLAWLWSHGPWQWRTQGDAALVRADGNVSRGYMVTQRVGYVWQRGGVDASLGYFHTDDYATRLYAYERGPLYQFSFPSFYGHGFRLSLLVRHALTPRLLLLARLATTDYLDRDHISSGLQQIDHSSQTDLDVQLRWKF